MQASFHRCRTQFCLKSCTGEQATAVFVFDISPPTAGQSPVDTDRVWKHTISESSFEKRFQLNNIYETFQSYYSLTQHYRYCKKKPNSRAEKIVTLFNPWDSSNVLGIVISLVWDAVNYSEHARYISHLNSLSAVELHPLPPLAVPGRPPPVHRRCVNHQLLGTEPIFVSRWTHNYKSDLVWHPAEASESKPWCFKLKPIPGKTTKEHWDTTAKELNPAAHQVTSWWLQIWICFN